MSFNAPIGKSGSLGVRKTQRQVLASGLLPEASKARATGQQLWAKVGLGDLATEACAHCAATRRCPFETSKLLRAALQGPALRAPLTRAWASLTTHSNNRFGFVVLACVTVALLNALGHNIA